MQSVHPGTFSHATNHGQKCQSVMHAVIIEWNKYGFRKSSLHVQFFRNKQPLQIETWSMPLDYHSAPAFPIKLWHAGLSFFANF